VRHRALSWAALAAVVCVALIGIRGALADEGMWTFDNPPLEALKKRYDFTPSKQWLDHLRLSSVRFNDGGSGSFVSGTGLVLTNHHVALDQLQKLSSSSTDYARDGFLAHTPKEEIKCPDLELNVLESMEDVTARVTGAASAAGEDQKAAFLARKAEIAKIAKESKEKTGLESEVVTLYQGGEYWLYRYKKYTDVRVVFAPELQAAFFGGDPDNFTYPRYDLDLSLMRVYENNQPYQPKDYLKWSREGAKEGDLVFVTGNPGSTGRLLTVAQMEYLRDVQYPAQLAAYDRNLAVLRELAQRDESTRRAVENDIFSLENSKKAVTGYLSGLQDSSLMAKKRAFERDFRRRIAADPKLKARYGASWDAIATSQKELAGLAKQ
jgi:Peptidase S46